jgi:O-antigen/teichoic acid export membrane protein
VRADDDTTKPAAGERDIAPAGDADVIANERLRDAALSGVRWVAGARVASEIVAFAAAVALARLLSPAEFGRAAVALVLVPLAAILTFEGCASSLVQRPRIGRAHRDSAAFLSIATGLVLTILTAAISPLLAPVFGDRIAELVLLVSPVFVLASPGCVPRALLWRELRFRRLSMIEVCGLLAGSATSVGLAVSGLKAEALIGGGLAMTGVTSLLLCLSAPIGTPRLRRREAKDIAGFGIPAALAGLVHVGFANVDYVIMAARLTATQAGLYWRAAMIT